MKSIAAALVLAQTKMGKALTQSTNSHFKSSYADLASVMDACMPALNESGIAVIQPTGEDEVGRYVETILIHSESADTLSCRVPLIIQKNDMQGYGSAVTYARRYGLMAMAGIAPEDDDGNAAAKAPPNSADTPTRQKQLSANVSAWRDSVMDSLPENPSKRESAQAFADAIIADFNNNGDATPKGLSALKNSWNKLTPFISKIEAEHMDLHEQIVDAYENLVLAQNDPFSQTSEE